MINPKATISYAQFHEDIILSALFHDIDKGYYVDVGANYPTIDSVTKFFYDRGWRGVNIEPIPYLYKQLVEARPEDTNLNIGIGNKETELKFYENITISGHSSFNLKNAQTSKRDTIKEYLIPVKTLEQVITDNKIKKINFIKIDVEGFEKEVIEGLDWSKFRPEVLCIEANHRANEWQKILTNNKYKLFINDGLNEYYLSEESWYKTIDFADRIVKIDYNTLRQHQYDAWTEDSKQLTDLTEINQKHYNLLQQSMETNKKLNKENRLSLKNKKFLQRLKISIYGLTVDWAIYLKNKTK